MENKKNKQDLTGVAGIVEEESLNLLVNACLAAVEDEYKSEAEPFERYTKKVRLQLYQDLNNYASRFVKGYQILLKELK